MREMQQELKVYNANKLSRVKPKLFFALLVLSATPQFNLRAQDGSSAVPSQKLSDSAQRVVFDKSAFFGPSTPLPQWSNGYLASHEVETFQSGVPNVRLYDRSGGKVREAAIWFRDSKRVLIYSAMATPDGNIIASGSADKMDGTSQPFIVLTDLAGSVTRTIQTGGYVPAHVCGASDETVWSFGGTGFSGPRQPNPGDTLRHFDFQKGEMSSYLPRESLPQDVHPSPEATAYIGCSAHEVVVYSPSAQKYIQMNYGDAAPSVYRTEAPSGLRLVGFAVTDSGKTYGYFSRSAKRGLYFLSLNAASHAATWVPVQSPGGVYSAAMVSDLWGSDGEQLVLSRAEDTAGDTALHWTTPTD
jgi:hypothetical protein